MSLWQNSGLWSGLVNHRSTFGFLSFVCFLELDVLCSIHGMAFGRAGRKRKVLMVVENVHDSASASARPELDIFSCKTFCLSLHVVCLFFPLSQPYRARELSSFLSENRCTRRIDYSSTKDHTAVWMEGSTTDHGRDGALHNDQYLRPHSWHRGIGRERMRFSFLHFQLFIWSIDCLIDNKLTLTWLVYWIRTARSVSTGAGLKWPNTAGQHSTCNSTLMVFALEWCSCSKSVPKQPRQW